MLKLIEPKHVQGSIDDLVGMDDHEVPVLLDVMANEELFLGEEVQPTAPTTTLLA